MLACPERHHKDYSLLKGTLDATRAFLVKKIGAILGLSNPISTEIITDGVVQVAVDSAHWMLNGLAILNVKSLHLRELAIVSAVVSDEPSGDSDRLRRVKCESRARSPELFLAEAVGLQVTSIFVAQGRGKQPNKRAWCMQSRF